MWVTGQEQGVGVEIAGWGMEKEWGKVFSVRIRN